MESSFTLFRVRGIRIGANWSWLFVFAFIIYTLASVEFPRTYPGLPKSSYVAMGFVAGVLFVTSLLLHELGHAFRALREGMQIEGITLWLFGGVARFTGMFPSAGAEFRIAIAGPIVSVLLSVGFFGLTALLNSASAPPYVVGVTDYLARINAILVAFNMLPALPLDGGRVLRSYLWHRQGNYTTATMSAARVARFLAGLMIAFGLLTYIQGAGFGGLWFSFIGWFLLQAAQSEVVFARFRSGLGGLRVRDVMTPDPVVVGPDQMLLGFIDEFAHARGHSTYPVVDGLGGLAGLVSLRSAGQVPVDRRAATPVRNVMLTPGDFPVVSPDDELFDVLPVLQRPPGRAVVVDNATIAGIVSASDVARALEREQILGSGVAGAARTQARPDTQPEQRRRRRTPAAWIIGSIVVLALAGFVFKPPVAVLSPGTSFDVASDIHITGVQTDHVHGRYLLTSVEVDQPTGLGLVWAMARSREIVPISAILPRGVDQKQYIAEQRKMFEQSELIAAGAAARAAGMHVELTGKGVRVVDIVPGAPASKVLRKGDVITSIDGTPVSIAEDVGKIVRARPAGTEFTFTVERNGQRVSERVPSRAGVVQEGPGIGIFTETKDLAVHLPFKVSFRSHDIGGGSAGLAYALATYDLITHGDLARGRSIAATGTIDLDGYVGPIGGVRVKAAAAKGAGAQLFLVPSDELPDAHGTGLETHGVATLQDAIRTLERQA